MKLSPAGSNNRALIVTTGAVESRAVRSLVESIEERTSPQGTVYEVGTFGSWQVALLEIGAAGSDGATAIQKDLNELDPRLVLFVGTAGGIREVRVGDVVAATAIHDFFDHSSTERSRFLDGLDHIFEQRIRAEARKQEWLERLDENRPSSTPQVRVGPLAMFKEVVSRPSAAKDLRNRQADVLAAEMEVGWLPSFIDYLDPPRLVIRGISELWGIQGTRRTSDTWEIAANHAAAFSFQILEQMAANGNGTEVKSYPIPQQPVKLHSLHIENLRVFDDFTLETGKRTAGIGQWTVLLGDNGVGKTTILRALVFALADQRIANSFFQLSGTSAPFLRDSSEKALVEVSVGEQRHRARITRTEKDIEELTALDPESAIPIYAYGCQRGTALGGPSREVEFRPIDDVRSLFDDSARLIHAETWLQNLRHAALESDGGPAEAFFDTVRETVVAVLNGVESMEVNSGGVWLSGPNVDTAPLSALSDGYITTAGWLLDLIARWAHRCQRAGIELDRDFREKMTALVLIDEIDLHLHPLWQIEIISTLREQFPRLSFVATTHNPLTLLGAREGEIHILQRDETGRVVAHQRDIPPGARADQVLTGEWFGLVSTVDRETLALLDEHRGLLREGVQPDDPRRQELERKLRQRLGTFQDTAVDRMVQGIAAELMDEDFEELTPQQRQRIREKILRRAKERVARGDNGVPASDPDDVEPQSPAAAG
jgi:nucleoside phosphorylase/energy-coupling factor transporter ATP-binding protein EcfA2